MTSAKTRKKIKMLISDTLWEYIKNPFYNRKKQLDAFSFSNELKYVCDYAYTVFFKTSKNCLSLEPWLFWVSQKEKSQDNNQDKYFTKFFYV